MSMSKWKNILGKSAAILGIGFVVGEIAAQCKKADSRYENEPEQKNPLEGKRVVFKEDEREAENADGVKGRLEAVGESIYEPDFYTKYIKRGLDVILSFGGLVALSPVLGALALAIKIDDPGPVLFTQKRVGENKKYFKLHKFRSMKVSAPQDVPTHMLADPDRYITRVGRFMRRHSMDELPQIWDVFIGNMSVIGPRPGLWNQDVLMAERDKYGANDVKPGLTGWAQINGRDKLTIMDKARLDGEYVQKLGIVMDARCFFGSLGVFGGDKNVVEGEKDALTKELPLPSVAPCHENLDFSSPKKILIAGTGSYIGESFKAYISLFDQYTVDSFSTTSDSWKNLDFSSYDVVYDVAGIAHMRETVENCCLYYEVNRDLAVAIAKKAKAEGVGQFIYLSSMSVYGLTSGRISENTPLAPANAYGKSKKEAEMLLWQLADESFKISILRPPMVYGKGCKGNYQTLRRFAVKAGFFPEYDNERSMLYVDNLSSAVRGIIHNEESGVYFPQNLNYVRTYDMVKQIAQANGKKFIGIKALNLPVEIAAGRIGICGKVFGSLVYDQKMNVPRQWIEVPDNEVTIRKTEGIESDASGKENLLVSILTVCYNSEKTIARTIEAVLNQTYGNIEYIIIDGASQDGTVKVVRSFQEAFLKRPGRSLTIISEPDKGMYDALNKGAGMAKGVLIGQTNADDFYEPDAVSHMVKLYKESHYDVAWGSIRVLKPSGNTIKRARIGCFWTTSGWCHPAMFSRREVLLETPYVCRSMYDDFDFITSVYQQGKKIITTDKVIADFSFGGMSTKRNLIEVKKRVDILYKIYRNHGMSRLYYLQRWGVELVKYILG